MGELHSLAGHVDGLRLRLDCALLVKGLHGHLAVRRRHRVHRRVHRCAADTGIRVVGLGLCGRRRLAGASAAVPPPAQSPHVEVVLGHGLLLKGEELFRAEVAHAQHRTHALRARVVALELGERARVVAALPPGRRLLLAGPRLRGALGALLLRPRRRAAAGRQRLGLRLGARLLHGAVAARGRVLLGQLVLPPHRRGEVGDGGVRHGLGGLAR
mmetsp:Transcript_14129/g.42262  ORF Transcript_14129/g.42262 Transcript_14129/m.42262 type:complete len:214 (-) Transcript_14129:97-738(-)